MTDTLTRLTVALSDRYRVTRELGAGGMATVYLAHDLRHEREVAIKVLHPDLGSALGSDRFLAEIKTTAKLQHPHILPLLDSGEADGLLYYVMPFVRGETLRARLERERQLPIPDAVRIAREVAGALEHAHKQGVIHRDIKPENILLQDGAALVADFGIALAVQTAAGARMTQTGLSLGTPQYMSPEQAMGERTVDARSDIYALGAVTYEMLTGEPPFAGNNVQAIVAKVLTERPVPLRTLRDMVSTGAEAAVMQSLAKLPADRQESAREFADMVSATTSQGGAASTATQPSAARPSRVPLLIMGAVTVAALSVAAWMGTRGPKELEAPVYRLAVDLSADRTQRLQGPTAFAVSHNGRTVAYALVDSLGNRTLYLRHFDNPQFRAVDGSNGALAPFWSPDDRFVGYVSDTRLYKVDTRGGRPSLFAEVGAVNGTPLWLANGDVVFTRGDLGEVLKVREGAARAEPLARPEAGQNSVSALSVLPDGHHVIVSSGRVGIDFRMGIIDAAESKATAPRQLTRLTQWLGGTSLPLRAVEGGYLIVRNTEVWFAPFDPSTFDLAAEPTPLVTGSLARGISVSVNGVLTYLSSSDTRRRRMIIVDRSGKELKQIGEIADGAGFDFYAPRFSPDGQKIAYEYHAGRGTGDLYVYDLVAGRSTRVTADEEHHNSFVAWHPDSKQLVFQSTRTGDAIYRKEIGGPTEQPLGATREKGMPSDWSPDGRTILYSTRNAGGDVWRMTPAGDSAAPVLQSDANEMQAVFSPDGKWIAYASDEQGGRHEVIVRRWPLTEEKWIVSRGGGEGPRWRRDGSELYFTHHEPGDPRADLMVTAVDGQGPSFRSEAPRVLFRLPLRVGEGSLRAGVHYDVTPDGQRFVLLRYEDAFTPDPPTLQLFVNWRTALATQGTSKP